MRTICPSVCLISLLSWVHSELQGVKGAFVFGGAGICMACPLSETLRELLLCANTHTFWLRAMVLSSFALGLRFYIGHQVTTQHGAKIVYRTKVNVNVFSVFSTVSMQCQVPFCSFPISICHITK